VTDSLDVAVVGGGVIGVASAWRLAARGVNVGLFEQHALGTGASLRNAGQVRTSECTPLAAPGAIRDGIRGLTRRHASIRVLRRPTPSLIRWLWCFARATREPLDPRRLALADLGHLSHDLFADFARHHSELLIGERGALDVFETPSGWNSARMEASVAREHGFSCEALNLEEARAVEPMLGDSVEGALWFPSDTSVEPHQFLAALASEAREAGAQLYAAHAVERIVTSGARALAIRVNGRTINVRTVVLACGHATTGMTRQLGLRAPLMTGMGYTVDLRASRSLRVPLVFVERHVAATPLGARARLAGGMIVGARKPRVPRGAAAALERSVRDVLPGLAATRISPPWAGLRPLTPDGLPMIGRFSQLPNVVAATGHGMLGVTYALGTAELVAEICAGARHESSGSAAFSPDRFSRRAL
jgi:D-amino-acid dehydrogenase